MLVIQSYPTHCDPMDYSHRSPSVHGILLARILEWVAIPFSKESFQPRNQPQVSLITGKFITIWASRNTNIKEAEESEVKMPKFIVTQTKQEKLKPFDCVDHNKVWEIPKEMGIPNHLPKKPGCESRSNRSRHGKMDWFKIGKGVLQGCILSPCLFNFYAEYIMQNTWLDESEVGIKISGRNISNFKYADGPTLMTESEEEVRASWWRVKEGVKKLA